MNYFKIYNIIKRLSSSILDENSNLSKIYHNEKRNKISKTNKGNQYMYRKDSTCDYDYSNLMNKEII